MRYLLPFFCLCFSLCALSSQAQESGPTQVVRGRVTDQQSSAGLFGAMVQLLEGDSSKVVVTDIEGYFKMEGVPVGRISLAILYTGYNNTTLNNLDLTSGKELVLNITLEEEVTQLETVKIKTKKGQLEANNENVVASNVKLNPEQNQKFAGTLQDVSRMAANYAGVVPAGDQRNDIIVRGNSPLGIIWRLEGINIPNPNHFGSLGTTGGPVSILNNNNLASSDFLTGAFPAEFGNGTAGAFDLMMRKGNNEKHEFMGQMGFNGAEVGLEGPISKNSKASYMANYRYSTLGIFDALGISFGVSAIPQYQDVAFKIDLPAGKKWGRFQLFGIGGLSYIELLDSEKEEDEWSFTNSGTDVYFTSNMGVGGLQHKIFLTDHTYLSTTIAGSIAENFIASDTLDIATRAPTRVYRNDVRDTKLSLNSFVNTKFNAQSSFRAGVIVDLLSTNYQEQFRASATNEWHSIVDFKGNSVLFQSYAQWRYKFSQKWVLNAGAHHQLFTLNGSQIVEPRLGIKFQASAKQSFSFAAGQHSQMQPLRVYLLETDDELNNAHLSNRELDFTKSIHTVLGYNLLLNQDFRIKIEGYYQSLYDIPVEEDSYYSLANAGADFVFNDVDSLVNDGTGTNMGIELTFEKVFSNNYYFLVNSSVYDSRYVGGDGVERNTAFNGNFNCNALAGVEFNLSKKAVLTLDGRFIIAGGKRYLQTDLPASIAAGTFIYDESEIFTQRYKDYARLDVKLGFKLNGKNVTQLWAIDVQNVTNRENIFRELYDAETQGIRYEYQMGIFPIVLYKITF